MRRALALALAATLPLICALPAAADEEEYARKGVYVGLAGTASNWATLENKLDRLVAPLGYAAKVDNALGLDARVGYRFHAHMAAEAQFEWVSPADVDLNPFLAGSAPIESTVETWILTANGKGFLFTGRMQPYAVVGVGVAQGSVLSKTPLSFTKEAFAARFGVGFDLYATQNLVANIEVTYVLPTGGLDGFDRLSFVWGLQWRF